jgi:AraC-like DNA-binding protein
MRIMKLLGTRAYLRRILLSISVLLALSVLIASFALSYHFERTAVNVRHQASMNVLSQMNYNANYLNDSIKVMANNLYYDIDVRFLRFAKGEEPENYQIIRSVGKLDYAIASSPFLHSIFVYNGKQKDYYIGGWTVRSNPGLIESTLDAMLAQGPRTPKLRLLPVRLSDATGTGNGVVDFFSMVMYDPSQGNGLDDALVLNIKPEWLFDNIRQINSAAGAQGSTVHLLDAELRPLNPDATERVDMNAVSRLLERRLQASPERESGYFTVGSGASKSVVGYIRTRANDWTIIHIQPYELIRNDIRSMRITTLWITGCVLLLFGALAFIVSRRLYNPIETVIGKFTADAELAPSPKGVRDEIGYLSDVYSTLLERVRSASRESTETRNAVKTYHLKRLMQSSSSIRSEEFKSIVKDNGLRIAEDGPYAVAVLKIDGFPQLAEQAKTQDLKLLQFAVSNIAEEIIRTSGFSCEVAEMRADHWAIVVGRGDAAGSEEIDRGLFKEAIRRTQRTVSDYYKLSLTASIGEPFDSYERIASQYNEVLHNAQYKILFGNGALIEPSTVASRRDHPELDVPPELEKRLVEGMKSGDLPALEEALDKYVEHISRYDYDNLIHALLHLSIVVRQTVREVNRNKLQPVSAELGDLQRDILTLEHLNDIKERFRRTFEALFGQGGDEADKGRVLADTIRDIVDGQYADLNLSLQGIAAMLKMSPVYVGRVFKRVEGVSVAEYVNEVRLAHAERLLLRTDDSILDIMGRTGFGNQSQFFKLFKKKFGTTPKEYRLKHAIREL